jgi:hypothetical protein
MGPSDEVVGEDGGVVVVVVEGGVVVVVVGVPPPPPPPPPVPPPPLPVPPPPPPVVTVAVVAGVVGTVTVEMVEAVDQRFTRPMTRLLLVLEESAIETSVLIAFESLVPTDDDAEASMLIIAKRTQDETTSVETLMRRCVVFARKKFLREEPLYMKHKFAGSDHVTTYEKSTVAQIC